MCLSHYATPHASAAASEREPVCLAPVPQTGPTGAEVSLLTLCLVSAPHLTRHTPTTTQHCSCTPHPPQPQTTVPFITLHMQLSQTDRQTGIQIDAKGRLRPGQMGAAPAYIQQHAPLHLTAARSPGGPPGATRDASPPGCGVHSTQLTGRVNQ